MVHSFPVVHGAVRPYCTCLAWGTIILTWAVTKVRVGGLDEPMRREHKLMVLGCWASDGRTPLNQRTQLANSM